MNQKINTSEHMAHIHHALNTNTPLILFMGDKFRNSLFDSTLVLDFIQVYVVGIRYHEGGVIVDVVEEKSLYSNGKLVRTVNEAKVANTFSTHAQWLFPTIPAASGWLLMHMENVCAEIRGFHK